MVRGGRGRISEDEISRFVSHYLSNAAGRKTSRANLTRKRQLQTVAPAVIAAPQGNGTSATPPPASGSDSSGSEYDVVPDSDDEDGIAQWEEKLLRRRRRAARKEKRATQSSSCNREELN